MDTDTSLTVEDAVALSPQIGKAAAPREVLVDAQVLHPFFEAAVVAYRTCTPKRPPGCWALLVGRLGSDWARVEQLHFADSVRASDVEVLREFDDVIVPRFGEAYRNSRRGFWCSSAELLRVSRAAEKVDMEILGSIHLHPDWHRIGPLRERALRIDHGPTPMDDYLFRNTGWPVNLICYVTAYGAEVFHTVGGWAPADEGVSAPATELPIRWVVPAGSDR